MNKKIIIINSHSFVDVITNSSTELFVLNINKSIDLVKEMLNNLIKEYNKKVDEGEFDEKYGDTVYPGTKACIDNFKEPYVYTKEMHEKAKEEEDRYKKQIEEDNKNRIKEGKTPWSFEGSYLWGYECEDNIGKIMIESSNDNSVPYDMWDMINETFNGINYHLG